MEFGLLALLAVGVGLAAFAGIGGSEDVGQEELNLVEGSDGPDNPLDGTEEADLVRGLGGDDTINGLEGNDRLESGAGGGRMYGGLGDDTLDGSEGTSDEMSFYGGAGADTFIGSEGRDYMYSGGAASSMSLIDYEGLYGEADRDVMMGNGGPDILHFSEGDTVSGGEGSDSFRIMDVDKITSAQDPAVILDFEPNERLSIYEEAAIGGPGFVQATSVSWTTSGDDVEVQYEQVTIAVIRNAASFFSDANVFPAPNVV